MDFSKLHLSRETLKRYLVAFIPQTATQLAAAASLTVAMIMVGQTGGPHSIAVLGLADFWIFIVFMPITQTIIEVGGNYFSILFGVKKYSEIINYALKTLFSLFVVFLINGVIFYFSDYILILLSIDPVIAVPAGRLIWYSMLYLPLSSFNYFLQTYLSSQQIQKHFNLISFISTVLVILLCHYFIIEQKMLEFGFVPARFIQELIVMVLYLFLTAFESKKECFCMPKFENLFVNWWPFVAKVSYSVFGVMCEYICFEFNTYLAALLHNVNDFAVWEAWANVENLMFFISFAVANTFRIEIGPLVGQKNLKTARERTVAFYVYSFGISIVFSLLYWVFARQIAGLYFKDQALIEKAKYCIRTYSYFLFFHLIFYTHFTVFRLLKLDTYFFRLIGVFYPCIVIIINPILAFYFGLGLYGLIYGYLICTVVTCSICIHKLLYAFDWDDCSFSIEAEGSEKYSLLNE